MTNIRLLCVSLIAILGFAVRKITVNLMPEESTFWTFLVSASMAAVVFGNRYFAPVDLKTEFTKRRLLIAIVCSLPMMFPSSDVTSTIVRFALVAIIYFALLIVLPRMSRAVFAPNGDKRDSDQKNRSSSND